MPGDSSPATSLRRNVSKEFTPRGKRVLIMLALTPWLLLAVYYGSPYLDSQGQHLRAVWAHIEKIQPEWDRFCSEHEGFRAVQFFAYTDGDGEFGATGRVPSEKHFAQLRAFMVG